MFLDGRRLRDVLQPPDTGWVRRLQSAPFQGGFLALVEYGDEWRLGQYPPAFGPGG